MPGKSEKLPKTILIIDDDDAIRLGAARIAEEFAPQGVNAVATGEEGWKACQEKKYDLIVMDWKLPDLSGMALFNRLRQHPKYVNSPIIVMSGFLEKKDFSLLEEFPFTGLIEKPFTPPFFTRKVRELSREQDWFLNQKAIMIDVALAIERNGHQALQGIRSLVETAPKPVPIALAAARQFIASKNFSDAEALLRDLLKVVPDCALAMNELGKVLLHTQRFSEASYILRRALSLSPDNIERLCLLGNASLHMLDPEQASGYFSKAQEIDPEDEIAKAGTTLAANVDNYLCRSNVSSIPSSFAGLLNAIGITLVRTGKFTDGIEHYQSAMKYVNHDLSLAKLAYNLGLAFVRWGKANDALPWFRRSVEFSEGGFEKASNFVRRLSKQLGESEQIAPRYARVQAPIHQELELVNALDPSENSLADTQTFSLDNPFAGIDLDFPDELDESMFAQSLQPNPADATKEAKAAHDGDEETITKRSFGGDKFLEVFPDCEKFLRLLEKSGEQVEVVIEKLFELTDEYSNDSLRLAIKDGLKRNSCSLAAIKKWLKTQAKSQAA